VRELVPHFISTQAHGGLFSYVVLVIDMSCCKLISHLGGQERCKKDQSSNGQAALPVTWETALELNGTCLSMSDGTPAEWSDCMKTIKTGRCGLKRVAVSANGPLLWVECARSILRGLHAVKLNKPSPLG
jgi:hypothetical protein